MQSCQSPNLLIFAIFRANSGFLAINFKLTHYPLTKAIETWKKTKRIIKRMQQLSREEIFTTLPGTKRAKPLSKKVLGLI